MTPMISITGRSNSGKTTLIEKLVQYLVSSGYTISVIKHTKHDFEMDRPGKDSFRLKDSGASSVVITNDKKLALISDMPKPLSPVEIADNYIKGNPDLIIVEGHKHFDLPKIEVIGDSPEPPLYQSSPENIKAIVSDNTVESSLPQFRRNEIEKIAKFIEKEFILS